MGVIDGYKPTITIGGRHLVGQVFRRVESEKPDPEVKKTWILRPEK